jgi:uncharacterized protein
MPFANTIETRRQGLTILTTEACNFACVYCHQPHTPTHMCEDVQNAIIRFVERKARKLDQLDVSWFGGEPLANLRALDRLSSEFARIAEQNGIRLLGFMSTNGYLLDQKLFSRLVSRKISRYQITFDGPQVTHDKRRLAVDGHPTFNRIRANVQSFREINEDFEVLLRVHVTPDIVENVSSFLDELGEEFGADERFKITVANVSHWGGPKDHLIDVFDDPSATLATLESKVPQRNRPSGDNVFCNASDPTHLVIRPTGVVVKCAHSLDLEENRIGFLDQDGSFIYEAGKIDFWIRGMLTGDRDALRCPRNALPHHSLSPQLVQIVSR